MFARVNYNRSIRRTLGYNESKLRLGKAECLLAENFLKDPERLSREDKLNRFERLHVLNEKTKANTLHISLSFHPSDKLDNYQMKRITAAYMKNLSLDHQPYLAYRHKDTGHPHLHIVSTLIQHDGSRVKLDNILRYESLRITKQMEEGFSLTRFYRPDSLPEQSKELAPRKLIYGQPGRKEAVEHVLDHVVDRYRYRNINEMNAVLGLYNVKAKIVWEDQSMSKARGLMYHTLDEKGHLIGLSFKSSSFRSQPTLKKLEQKFALNQSLQGEASENVKNAIDWAFLTRPIDWEDLQKQLFKEKIYAIPEKEKTGEWRKIYYVDVSTRCVFEGETLGKRYTSQAIRARCLSEEQARLRKPLTLANQYRVRHHF